MGRRLALPLLLLVSVAAAAATLQADWTPARPAPPPPAAGPARADPLWPAIEQWNRLRQSDRLSFADYAAFLKAHPGWPGEAAMRRAAEKAIDPENGDPQGAAAYFAKMPPVTGAGQARYAQALAALGRSGEARTAAAAAWTGGALPITDETRLAARFAGQFTPAEQDRRMERLLWDRAAASATRQLPLVSPARRPLYATRLAFQMKTVDAAPMTGPEDDAGYLVDRYNWLRDTGRVSEARGFLARPRTLAEPPFDPRKWLETLLAAARGAAADKQPSLVADLARRAELAYPAGTAIRERPLPERDAYTSLVWLAGATSLKAPGGAADAARFFQRYAAAAQTPGSQAKGLYWAGRAALVAGNRPQADGFFRQAAVNVDQFYGQLATERLGRAITLPPEPARLDIPEAQRRAFRDREVVRAAILLGREQRWLDQTQFVRLIAQNARTDADHVLIGDLAREIGRPDLGVITSRQARNSGARDPVRVGFPQLSVPPAMQSHWTLIHAITRQESQFDRAATSPVGARGLMQLMPATAREQAGMMGLGYAVDRLIDEPTYNVTLGSAFFDRLMTRFNGNFVMSVAAYNAGPGNVNKFVRANGDPRLPGVDIVEWVEAIPLTETRGYVQKVLENAVMYDLLNPARARSPAKDRLSWYLGKRTAG